MKNKIFLRLRNKLIFELKNRMIYFILQFKNFKPENAIIIFSDARGGSTWLMEILNIIPNPITNWEPFHVEKGVVPKEWKLGNRPFIDKNKKNQMYVDFISKILSFKLRSSWTIKELREVSPIDVIQSKIIITKFVRANRLAPFILRNFQFRSKPILLIRHPIDVCYSQIKAFGNIEDNSLELPDSINDDKLIDYSTYIKELKTPIERQIAIWCLNNCYLLEDKVTLQKMSIVFYSDLLLTPELETSKILNTFSSMNNLDIRKKIESIDFKKPSQTDFKKNLINDTQKQLNKNFELMSITEKDKIQSIFNHFNFKLFDAYSPYPKKEYVYV